MADMMMKAEDASKRNWADEDDEGDEGEDVEIGGSSVAQVGSANAAAAGSSELPADGEEQKQQAPRTFMPNKPRQKRERNIYGDFVVTKINIKEREVAIP